MIIEFLNFIPCIRNAASIHYMYNYRKDDGFNVQLFKLCSNLHDELYDGKSPSSKDWKYRIGKLILCPIGDFIFKRHSLYMHCDMLHSRGDIKEFQRIYDRIPKSYQYLIRKHCI